MAFVTVPIYINELNQLDQKAINDLIHKYGNNTATDAELRTLMSWYRKKGYGDAVYPDIEHEVETRIFSRLLTEIPLHRKKRSKTLAVAASLIFLIALYALFRGGGRGYDTTAASMSTRLIKPGANKAILTLANGEKIDLNQNGNVVVAYQNGIKIVTSSSGQLVYAVSDGLLRKSDKLSDKNIDYNTLSTPRGGQFEVVLPDGSKVWLNAESSIRFPVSFAPSKSRHVDLEGEAYFEIRHLDNHPFTVSSGNQLVEVLGTHFNIMSYNKDKGVKTTLLQGRVSVSLNGVANNKNNKVVLAPGQQSISVNQAPISVSNVDINEVIAWKNGYFRFEDERLEDIMTTISRWYDFTPVFEDETLKNEKFGAYTARFTDIASLLGVISRTGNVKFVVQGKTIRIMKK